MKAYILRCRPGSQFHFGKMALDDNSGLHDTSAWFHSDTLFSALINIVASFSDARETDEVVALFQQDKVRISSGMFCLSNGDKDIFFLPRPAHFTILHEDLYRIKDVGRVQFISKKIWELGIGPSEIIEQRKEEYILLDGRFLLWSVEVEDWDISGSRVYSVETFPKVHARKLDQKDAFYFESNVVLPTNPPDAFNMHYYFLLDSQLDDTQNDAFARLQAAIQMLPETGIGGERSGGCGQFLSIEEKPFHLADYPHEGYVTLGLTSPKNHDEIDRLEYYDTVLRGGRRLTNSDGLLKQVRMVLEGAYVRDRVQGNIPAVNTSKVPYLRYGMPLLLPAHKNTVPPTQN